MIDNKFFPFTVLDFKRHIVCSIHHHSITMCPRQISGIWLISFDDIRSLSRNFCGNAKQRSFLIVIISFILLKKANTITAIATIIRMGTIRSIMSYIRFTSRLKSASHFKLFLTILYSFAHAITIHLINLSCHIYLRTLSASSCVS